MKAIMFTLMLYSYTLPAFSQANNAPHGKNGLPVLNIDDIKVKKTGRYLIYFSGSQWKQAIGDLKVQELDPKDFKTFQGIIMFSAGNDPLRDGMYLVPPECNPPCELLYIPGQLPKCDCTGVNLPCGMYLTRGKIVCKGNCGNGKDCQPNYVRFQVGAQTFYGFACKCK